MISRASARPAWRTRSAPACRPADTSITSSLESVILVCSMAALGERKSCRVSARSCVWNRARVRIRPEMSNRERATMFASARTHVSPTQAPRLDRYATPSPSDLPKGKHWFPPLSHRRSPKTKIWLTRCRTEVKLTFFGLKADVQIASYPVHCIPHRDGN
jgi:hypothetical protein